MTDPSPPDADPWARRRARAILLTGIVLTGLVVREGWQEFTKSRIRRASIDPRFASFAEHTRGVRRIGTLPDSDPDEQADRHRLELEYALAPAVLVGGTAGVRLVAGRVGDPERLEKLATEHRLRVLARSPDGWTLFEKATP